MPTSTLLLMKLSETEPAAENPRRRRPRGRDADELGVQVLGQRDGQVLVAREGVDLLALHDRPIGQGGVGRDLARQRGARRDQAAGDGDRAARGDHDGVVDIRRHLAVWRGPWSVPGLLTSSGLIVLPPAPMSLYENAPPDVRPVEIPERAGDRHHGEPIARRRP